MNTVDGLFTIPKAAEELGKSKMTLYRWLRSGKLVTIKLGGIHFVPLGEIKRLKNEKT